MGGFSVGKYNDILKEDTFLKMREFLIGCCSLMRDESVSSNSRLPNHEDKIKNKLVFNYLKCLHVREKLGYDLKLIFESEVSECFDSATSVTKGRVDIKVMSEDTFAFPEKYYTIECKRLDGYADLNRKYVKQGVARFVASDAKYCSSYGKNMMLGFMIRQVNIKENAEKINMIQNNELEEEIIKKEMVIIEEKDFHCIYEAEYYSPFGEIKLQHLFYDFSSVVCTTG